MDRPILKPIPGFPGYWAGSDGNVYSTRRRWKTGQPRQLVSELDDDSYSFLSFRVGGKRKRVKVHALIALAFHGPRPSLLHETRHLDGSRNNNNPDNLMWGMRKQNADDRERHGRTAKGPSIARARFTAEQVRAIRRRILLGERITDIAKDLNVYRQYISNLHNRRTYNSVS